VCEERQAFKRERERERGMNYPQFPVSVCNQRYQSHLILINLAKVVKNPFKTVTVMNAQHFQHFDSHLSVPSLSLPLPLLSRDSLATLLVSENCKNGCCCSSLQLASLTDFHWGC